MERTPIKVLGKPRLNSSTLARRGDALALGELLVGIKARYPGWDQDNLRAEFDAWIGADPARMPHDYARAFEGFVKRYHERNRHQLRD